MDIAPGLRCGGRRMIQIPGVDVLLLLLRFTYRSRFTRHTLKIPNDDVGSVRSRAG